MKKIDLTHGRFALVDDEDYEKLDKFNWSLYVNVSNKRSVYPRTYIDGKTYFMHQLLMPKKKGYVTDHKDQDGLNNQKNNLRYATLSENAINQRIGKNNKTGVTGVSLFKGVYYARIQINGKTIHLGHSNSLEVATKYRREAEEKYFPGLRIEQEKKVEFLEITRTPVVDVKRYKNATQKYKGVYRYGNKWGARIKAKGVRYYLGNFSTEKGAALAYIKAFEQHHGVKPYTL